MAEISDELVRKMAQLARIGVSDEEVQQLKGDFEKILAFVAQLDSVNVEGVEPVTHITGLENATRNDAADAKPLPAQDHDLLEEQAPGVADDGGVRVPRIIP